MRTHSPSTHSSARTTAAGCVQKKKQIVPWFYAKSKLKIGYAQSILVAGGFMVARVALTMPTMLLGGGGGLIFLGIVFFILGAKCCGGSSAKVDA